MTLPSPNQFPAIAYQKGLSERAYPSYSAFLWDVVPIIKSEIRALVDEGVKYVQIDAPRYSYYLDPKWREYIRTEMGRSVDEADRFDLVSHVTAQRAPIRIAVLVTPEQMSLNLKERRTPPEPDSLRSMSLYSPGPTSPPAACETTWHGPGAPTPRSGCGIILI